MKNMMLRKASAVTAAFALATLGLAACGGSDDSGDSETPTAVDTDALDAALEEGGELTYWTWTPSGEDQAAGRGIESAQGIEGRQARNHRQVLS